MNAKTTGKKNHLPKGGDEERIPPSVPHITNVQDTQRDPQPNTTRYIGPGTHTRIALTPPLITGGAYESATPVRSGFLGGDVYGCVQCVVSVSNLRSSVSREGLYIVAVPRSQNPPPRTSAPTPSEPEPPPPPPRARILPRPEHPTAEDPRDKHPHPPTCCARQHISREPTMEPSKALSRVTIVPSHPPAKHPDRVSSWDCGCCALRPMRGYRKRPDSRGAPGSFKCPVYSTDTLHPRLTSLAEDILVHSVILWSGLGHEHIKVTSLAEDILYIKDLLPCVIFYMSACLPHYRRRQLLRAGCSGKKKNLNNEVQHRGEGLAEPGYC
ncbi:hypothetical protein DPMN_169904 [Dreissena polymorpha]|uniref:Uncharacterized protein n=1 Tax=Dreissena polymorpha TaxID=45954 RepID=A0A9D4DXL8_DREPO|nr:hypothetical protein DPMN_169904 [Dreissena polymorpha]